MLTVLKIGGSVFSSKEKPFSLELRTLYNIAEEIAYALDRGCVENLVLVHGGGSYGHYIVAEHGASNSLDMAVQVAYYMRELNEIVVDALHRLGVPAVGIDTHALAYLERERLVVSIDPILAMLSHGAVPVLYGDIVLGIETMRIVSGDELAWILASSIVPSRILFATNVDGVFDRDPRNPNAKLLNLVEVEKLDEVLRSVGGSSGIDVTGGMRTKLELATKYFVDGIREVVIFNGRRRGYVLQALCGIPERCTRLVRHGT